MANGIDLQDIAFDVALGRTLKIESQSNYPCAVLELFPKTPGIFVGVENLEELEKLESLRYLAMKQPIGTYVGSSSDGYKMCVIVIMHHTDTAVFDRELNWVNKHVQVQTRAA